MRIYEQFEELKSMEHFAPGRYWATVEINGELDKNAIIGRDAPMETYFFQSGKEDPDTDAPVVWLGRNHGEWETFTELREELARIGVKITEWELERV
jgi:hypothetical protein